MSYIERVLVVFKEDGSFKGAHAADERGFATPVTAEGLDAVLPQVGGLMARLEAAEAEIEAVTLARDKAVDQVGSLTIALQDTRDELDTLKASMAAMTAERNTLRADVATLGTERDALQAERQALRQERDALQAERDALQVERATLLSERDALRTERDALQAEKDAAAARALRSVSPLQARKALKASGLLTTVQTMVDAAPEDDDVRLAWDWALAWERDSPFVNSLGHSLGLTSQQIDDLFALAATF